MKFETQKAITSIPLMIIGVFIKAIVIVKTWELVVMTSFDVGSLSIKQAIAALIVIVMLPRLSSSPDELDKCENIKCFVIKALSKMITNNAAYLVLAYVFYWLTN